MPTRTTAAPQSQEQRTRRADRRFGVRLLGAVAAAAAAAIPFALL
ncbi:phosphoesterase, partial [Streptomyces sp. SID2119]|nr:phosphoesterase [Streptomyces sp. SID2119]